MKNIKKIDTHKDVVYCISWHDNKKWTGVEISSDFKVYPCCTLHAFHQLDKTFFDEYLDSFESNWNDITKNSLDDILLRYREYIKPEKWKSMETTPNCCKKACIVSHTEYDLTNKIKLNLKTGKIDIT